MGKRYLRSIVSDVQTLAASADIVPIDLPVNPLSHLILTINLVIDTTQVGAATFRFIDPFLQAISSLSVRHRGENIIDGNLQDLAVINSLLCNWNPWGREIQGLTATNRSMSFPLSFSRVPYDHMEAFPATQRGNLRFFMTAGALPAGMLSMQWALESCELIEDNPVQFLKYTTLTRNVASTGRQRVLLPIGNDLLGLLLFDPTTEVDATETYMFGKVKILKDNVEQYYSSSNWEAIAAELSRRNPSWASAWGHRHAQAAADTTTGGPEQLTAALPPLQYGFLDWDPLRDNSFALETAGAADLQLDMDSDVSTGVGRMIPIEFVRIPGAAAAA
jgi:hypothetical protein